MAPEYTDSAIPNDITDTEFYRILKDRTRLRHFQGSDRNLTESGSTTDNLNFASHSTDIPAMLISASDRLRDRDDGPWDILLVSDGQSHFGRDLTAVRLPNRVSAIGVGNAATGTIPQLEEIITPEPALSGDSLRLAAVLKNTGIEPIHGQLLWSVGSRTRSFPVSLPPEFKSFLPLTLPPRKPGTVAGKLVFLSDEGDSSLLREHLLRVEDRHLTVWFDTTTYDPDTKMISTILGENPDLRITGKPDRHPGMAVIMQKSADEKAPFGPDVFKIVFSALTDQSRPVQSFQCPEPSPFTRIIGDPAANGRLWADLPPVLYSGHAQSNARALLQSGESGTTDLIQFDPASNTLWINARGLWKWQLGTYQTPSSDLYAKLLENVCDAARYHTGGQTVVFTKKSFSGLPASELVLPYQLHVHDASDPSGDSLHLSLRIVDEQHHENRRLDKDADSHSDAFIFSSETSGRFTAILSLMKGTHRLASDSAEVLIGTARPEQIYTGLNLYGLKALSHNNGGSFLTPDSLNQGHARVLLRPVQIPWSRQIQPRKSPLFLLMLFAVSAAEWFLRKRRGLL